MKYIFLINAQINHKFGNLKYTITKSLLINLISKISKRYPVYIITSGNLKKLKFSRKNIFYLKTKNIREILKKNKNFDFLICLNLFYILNFKKYLKEAIYIAKKKSFLNLQTFKYLETQLNPYKQLKIKNSLVSEDNHKNSNFFLRQELPKFIYPVSAIRIFSKFILNLNKQEETDKIKPIIIDDNEICFEIRDKKDYLFYKYLINEKKI